MIIRKQLRDRYLKQLEQLEPLSTSDLAASAIVFSPHQDDETLGCGATIARKKEAGAEVKIVFMTDGRLSHHHFIAQDKLIELRQQEAVLAAQKLGIAPEEVLFFGYSDGGLQQSSSEAIALVSELLEKNNPQQLFIPYVRETHPDHLATNQIVLAAVNKYDRDLVIYEYPIWYWHHFPWTKTGKKDSRIKYLKASLKAKIGWQLISEFNSRVEIEPFLTTKQLALAQHQTQMKRMVKDPNWGLLEDPADGEWLDCFFQKFEIFRRTII